MEFFIHCDTQTHRLLTPEIPPPGQAFQIESVQQFGDEPDLASKDIMEIMHRVAELVETPVDCGVRSGGFAAYRFLEMDWGVHRRHKAMCMKIDVAPHDTMAPPHGRAITQVLSADRLRRRLSLGRRLDRFSGKPSHQFIANFGPGSRFHRHQPSPDFLRREWFSRVVVFVMTREAMIEENFSVRKWGS